MNLYLLTTEKMSKHAHNLSPSHNVLGLNEPNGFSNNIKFPKTLITTLSNWYNAES